MEDYQQMLEAQTQLVKDWKSQSEDALCWKPGPQSWSVLECLAHLNRYATYYLPRLEKAVAETPGKGWAAFKSGTLGGYFVRSIQPGSKPLKTPNKLDFNGEDLTKAELDTFLANQAKYQTLASQLDRVNLRRNKIVIEVLPILRMKIGDAFLFNLYHQERHLLQASQVLKLQQAQGAREPGLAG
ncbi:MAG: DinB family protein [Bacteroidota bacterium]